MGFPSIPLPLVFLTLILLPHLSSSSRSPQAASALCRNSDAPSLCLRIATRVPSPDPIAMTRASIKAASAVARRARVTAALLSPQNSLLRECSGSYGDILDGLREAGRLLEASRTRAGVMNYLSAASFGVTACEDASRDAPSAQFPLLRLNRTLRNYVSNALAMADLLSPSW